MKRFLLNQARKMLKHFNVAAVSSESMQLLKEMENDNKYLLSLSKEEFLYLVSLAEKSKSQFKQDLFVLHQLNFKKSGFFVEFGATNGVDLSNTYLLEKEFGWTGILAEPAKCWHDELKVNRKCKIETNCVWVDSKSVLSFTESVYKELSTISSFSESDAHKTGRMNGKNYNVNSISLIDLLKKYDSPKVIDYLSIDTEGSEYDILLNFDFSKYSFNVISCEHNYTGQRNKIFNLLKKNGYERKFCGFSGCDDWYVNMMPAH
jgi:FkbM family methyltransferase